MMLIQDVWPDDAVEDQRRFDSSLALVNFARTCTELHPGHRRRLVDEAIWFWTERGKPSRKYKLRYRTVAALERQHSMGFTKADKDGGLAHDHVHERASAVTKLLAPANDASKVLGSLRSCVVTKDEHSRLSTAQAHVAGWARYRAAGIIPIDMNTGEPMDLDAAVASDVAAGIWG
jgi:hypothetical protein